MANQGLNSGVIIPLGKMGVRIILALSHFTVQAVIRQRHFPVTRARRIGFKNNFLLID